MSARFHTFLGTVTVLGALALGLPQPVAAQTPADNSKVNTRDRAAQAVTADQQKETPEDREITRKIRRAILADKSLSTYAHNIKIITRDGAVTLKGPVRSEEEKTAIVAKAATIVKKDQITNQVSIAPPKS